MYIVHKYASLYILFLLLLFMIIHYNITQYGTAYIGMVLVPTLSVYITFNVPSFELLAISPSTVVATGYIGMALIFQH